MINNSFTELGLDPQAKYQRGWWPLIAAGAGLVGSFLNQGNQNQANWDLTQSTNKQQTDLARETNQQQMEFQRNMSNTAHQREMEDLKAAGLNPSLAAGGSGSSTPSGGGNVPNLQIPGREPAVDLPFVMGVMSQAAQIEQNQQRINNETLNTKANVAKAEAETKLKGKGLIRAEAEGAAVKWIRKQIEEFNGRNSKKQIPMRSPQQKQILNNIGNLQ